MYDHGDLLWYWISTGKLLILLDYFNSVYLLLFISLQFSGGLSTAFLRQKIGVNIVNNHGENFTPKFFKPLYNDIIIVNKTNFSKILHFIFIRYVRGVSVKSKVKRAFIFTLTFVLFIFPSNRAYSASSKFSWQFNDIVCNDSFQMLMDNDKNVFLISLQNNYLCIKRIDVNNNCLSVNFDAPENYIGSAVSGGCVYIFASYISDNGAKTVVVTTYEFDSDSLYNTELEGINVFNKTDFAVSGGKIFCINDNNKRYINIYDFNGELIVKNKNLNNNIQLVTSSNGKEVFAFTVDKVYKINTNGSCEYISNHRLIMPVFLCEGNYVCDLKGAFYNLYSSNAAYGAAVHNNLPTGGISDGYYLRGQRSSICGINKKTNEVITLYNFNKDCTALCTRNNQVAIYSSDDNSFTIFNKSDLNYPKPGSTTSQSSNSSLSKPSNNSSNTLDLNFTSYVYRINGDYITGIKAGTTIAKFKKNVSYGNLLLFFKNEAGANKSSGNVGTGYVLSCAHNSKTYYTYHLIVAGDLTGEGNVNSRDVSKLSDYLIGKSQLSKCESMAADCNNDAKIDTMDLLKIAKNNI